jgi:hypothetical protein
LKDKVQLQVALNSTDDTEVSPELNGGENIEMGKK